jgi:hypothetical protein
MASAADGAGVGADEVGAVVEVEIVEATIVGGMVVTV